MYSLYSANRSCLENYIKLLQVYPWPGAFSANRPTGNTMIKCPDPGIEDTNQSARLPFPVLLAWPISSYPAAAASSSEHNEKHGFKITDVAMIIGGASYWLLRRPSTFSPSWAENVSGPHTFEHL